MSGCLRDEMRLMTRSCWVRERRMVMDTENDDEGDVEMKQRNEMRE